MRFPEKLLACWHPVAYSKEVKDSPFGTFLLDQAIVIWRSRDGRTHAMRDFFLPVLSSYIITLS